MVSWMVFKQVNNFFIGDPIFHHVTPVPPKRNVVLDIKKTIILHFPPKTNVVFDISPCYEICATNLQ